MAVYRRKVAEGALDADPAQRLAVEKLQLLAMRLADYNPARPKRVGLGRFGWGRDRIEEKMVPGLYLYGGVGRGKSMLMDLFFATAPVEKKRRVHFNAFMLEIHDRLYKEQQDGPRAADHPMAARAASSGRCCAPPGRSARDRNARSAMAAPAAGSRRRGASSR